MAIAGALAAEPALLVLDEPWSGLDADGGALLDAALARRQAARVAVVVADHREGPTPVADATWVVAGGGVRVAPGGEARPVRIEATGADGTAVVLDVPAAEVDATLRGLLDAGAAIRRVAP